MYYNQKNRINRFKCVKLRDGGVAVFGNKLKPENQLYLLFTAGYHSTTHKHADDLSFILNYGKTEFFVDSGKYNYNFNDPYRNYFRSTMAHNTITVDNQSYPLIKELVNKSKIDSFKIGSDYSYVSGSHVLYTGVKVRRTVIYLKKVNSVLIHDVMESKNSHSYTEAFNIGKDVQISKTGVRTFTLRSNIENREIELIQLTKMDRINSYTGSSNPIIGWQSVKFNQKFPITQIQFINTKKKNTESKFIINTNVKTGIQNYTVKSEPTYDYFTIVDKDGIKYHAAVDK